MYNESRNPARPVVGSFSGLPPDYVAAMRRTPRGLAALEQLKAFDQPGFSSKFTLTLQQDLLPDGTHGGTTNTEGGVETIISVNTQAGDRMQGWTLPEITNIVGVHEVGHLVFTASEARTDECACFYCPCHESAILKELVNRFQYSLIHPAEATGKSVWLDRYCRYFAAANKMRSDKDYAKLVEKMRQAASPDRFLEVAEEAEAYERKAPPKTTDTSYGVQVALEAYQAALSNMVAAAATFLPTEGAGLAADIGPYKDVLKNIQAYKADTKFALIG